MSLDSQKVHLWIQLSKSVFVLTYKDEDKILGTLNKNVHKRSQKFKKDYIYLETVEKSLTWKGKFKLKGSPGDSLQPSQNHTSQTESKPYLRYCPSLYPEVLFTTKKRSVLEVTLVMDRRSTLLGKVFYFDPSGVPKVPNLHLSQKI